MSYYTNVSCKIISETCNGLETAEHVVKVIVKKCTTTRIGSIIACILNSYRLRPVIQSRWRVLWMEVVVAQRTLACSGSAALVALCNNTQ